MSDAKRGGSDAAAAAQLGEGQARFNATASRCESQRSISPFVRSSLGIHKLHDPEDGT